MVKNMHARVKHLVQKYGTRNPEKLAREMGIVVIKRPFNKTMGFFKKALGKKFIVVNSNLPYTHQLIVIAHELGHALYHSSNSEIFLHEYTLFPRGKYEVEANRFAAELLINEKELDKYQFENMTVEQIAAYFEVPKELVEYKFNWKKYY
ncbi:ImmA/IrrE family metallo-endopeptidase [Caloramator sp. CAR-1]|uniref:ImmA/IrrE family metallo-endopeptidase n=1 Tax=Caloramator sp. CAR-1 TaxID=3062777 RepID=UPI0026E2A8AC|nr:ImmA/IrrE family metallo-endopeptidase [Caloramator sp. CAR-1]MDO6353567.1 ImmA/IrrE family metallo-endopeptidase [Caloramator sp. CAR-1]